MKKMSETPADASRAIVLACIKQLTDEHGSATYQQIIDAAGPPIMGPAAGMSACTRSMAYETTQAVGIASSARSASAWLGRAAWAGVEM